MGTKETTETQFVNGEKKIQKSLPSPLVQRQQITFQMSK